MKANALYVVLFALVLGVGCGNSPETKNALAADEQKTLEEKLAKAKLEKIVATMRAAQGQKFSKFQGDRIYQGNVRHEVGFQCLESRGNSQHHNPALSIAL